MNRYVLLTFMVTIASVGASSQSVPLLTTACETSLALSAAPDYLRDDASVRVLGPNGFETSQKGSNPFTCIVNRDHPLVLKPTCFDREGATTIVPKIEYVGRRLIRGDALESINADVLLRFESGEFASPQRAGVAYMLSRYNRPINRQTGELGFFPPHVMFYAPNLTNEDIGHDMRFHNPEQPLPMIAYGGPQGYMIMISDDGAPRARDDLHASCPDWIFASPEPVTGAIH